MIRKIVNKHKLSKFSEIKSNLNYWLSQPIKKRLWAVDYLRGLHNGDSERLQRVFKIVKRK